MNTNITSVATDFLTYLFYRHIYTTFPR